MKAVLFDFSGTLFRLDDDDRWFDGMEVDEHVQTELMERLTHPTGGGRTMTEQNYRVWLQRDLAPALHREAYLHALYETGLADPHAVALYERCIDPAMWTPYPDTVEVLNTLGANDIRTAVVSNIAFDIRPAFVSAQAAVDEFVLSFEVGIVKPDPRIFEIALDLLGVDAADAVMVGDSEENDGAARALGCGFVLVDPLPTAERPTGLRDGLRGLGLPL